MLSVSTSANWLRLIVNVIRVNKCQLINEWQCENNKHIIMCHCHIVTGADVTIAQLYLSGVLENWVETIRLNSQLRSIIPSTRWQKLAFISINIAIISILMCTIFVSTEKENRYIEKLPPDEIAWGYNPLSKKCYLRLLYTIIRLYRTWLCRWNNWSCR